MGQEEIDYQEALDYLYQYIDYSLTRQLRNLPEKFDLTRMNSLLERLGDPLANIKVIHVAGTKGKGSVAAFMASALQYSGNKVGLYTSPQLHEYTERIQINRNDIPKKEFVRLVKQVKPIVEDIPRLTTFEITTALAFQYFYEQGVDVAVVEVGLGGRLDATNVVTPVVSVITSISYDHTAVLGDTLAAIAYEKSGIIKLERPVVIAPQKEEALAVIREVAISRNSKLIQVSEGYSFKPEKKIVGWTDLYNSTIASDGMW